MKMTGQQLSGFIDVKVPPKGRKLGPWKAWKRQWCTIRISNSNSVEVALGNSKYNLSSSIQVPYNASICRSESRSKNYAFGVFLPESKYRRAVVFLAGSSETESQRWMTQIRTLLRPTILPVLDGEFSVSLIDNKHSRSAGLYGTYGILSLTCTEMAIKDPSNGDVKASWKWSQVDYTRLLVPTQNEEDTDKIIIIHQLSDFKGKKDNAELQFFCPTAAKLHSAVCEHQSVRQHRLMTSPLPPTPSSRRYKLHSTRRLSRSEGDLRWPLEVLPSLQHLRSRSGSRERSSKSIHDDDVISADENQSIGKIAKSLISASFGLMLSTPGCSEPDSLHDYQELSNEDLFSNYTCIDNELDDLPDLQVSFQKSFSDRRVSGASVASGIYEEIDEQPTEYYENLSDLKPGSLSDPPPLPPRKTKKYDRRFVDSGSFRGKGQSKIIPNQIVNEESSQRTLTEPDYLPMSPVSIKLPQEEDAYVVMANIISNSNKIIVSEPVPI